MKTKIKSLIALVMLSGASLTILFASPNTQPKSNLQPAPELTVPSIVLTGGGNGGMHTRADTVLPSARYGAHIDLNQSSVILDRLDIRSVTLTAPNQIGVNRSVAVSPNTRAQKFVNPDGSQIIVVIIRSSGASGIGVHFRNFALAAGEEVYVYGPAADSIVCGPYTSKGPWGSGEFWSGTLVGDTAIIEFYTKPDAHEKGFEIFEVSHIFPELDLRPRSGEPDVLSCEVDASCYPNNLNNAVARIQYNNNGSYVCTGTLLNDSAQDYTPYFLTADHCVSTQAVAQTVEAYWFYQTTSCNSGVLRSWVQSPPGANLLATQSSNDFSLLRLVNNPPSGAVFSGWTSALQSTGTGVFGLHHPGGFIPPGVDSYLRRASGTITDTNVDCSDTGLVNGYLTGWTSGTTEPGSSGSGLWNSNGYLVGVLSCGSGPPSCSSPQSWHSKFASFYSQIQPYIDSPTPTPTPIPGQYAINQIGSSIVPGTTDTGNHGDDVVTNLSLPFPFTLYDMTFNSINLSSNGNAQFVTTDNAWSNVCLPWTDHNYTILPYWDDLTTDINLTCSPGPCGIFTSVSGAAPHRIFNIEWRAIYYNNAQLANFELRLYEGQFRFDVIYGTVAQGNSSATAGVQKDNTNFTQYFCNGSGGAATGGQSYIIAGGPSPTTNRYDFNGDGHTDYVLSDASTHQTAIWYLNNNLYLSGAFAPTPPAGWALIDVADFNGDGHPDYALFNPSTRATAIWYLNNNGYVNGAYGPTVPSGWQLVAIGDFNGDGKPDYVLYNSTSLQTAIWYLNNNVYIGGGYGPTLPAAWQVVGVADFNSDGHADYLLFNPATRQSAIWYMSGRTRIGATYGPTIAAGYQLMGAADFNGNGKPDYALFNPTTGRTAIWYLNNNVYVSGAYGPTLPAGWSLAAP